MLYVKKVTVVLLLICFMIPCMEQVLLSNSPAPVVYPKTKAQYLEFIENTDLPEDFVYYRDEWDVLGSFNWMICYERDYSAYTYNFSAYPAFRNFDVSLRIERVDDFTYSAAGSEVTPESNLRFNTDKGYVICQVGMLQYRYFDGELQYIRWFDQREHCVFAYELSAKFYKYSDLKLKDDFYVSLLTLETSVAAQEQLFTMTDTKKPFIPEPTANSSTLQTNDSNLSDSGITAFPWLWVGIGGGAAVVIGGAVTAALIVRKKRRRAVADFCEGVD